MTTFANLEHHRFEAAGRTFVYLVPSAAIFAVDERGAAILDALSERPRSGEELVASLQDRHGRDQLCQTLDELRHAGAIADASARPAAPPRKILPLTPFPLTTMVLNVTSQCNLSCTYCYEYGEDRIASTTSAQFPRLMTDEVARRSVDFMFEESRGRPVAHVTFFGGETLMNFPVLQRTVSYARGRADALNKQVDFSLTTNATLLTPEIIEFIADNDIGVTVSIDGPREVQDKFRPFHGGRGSYDVVAPKIKALLARHRSRPVGARVTLTAGTLAVGSIFRHLTEDMGFAEVGFAPATSSAGRSFAFTGEALETLLEQFRDLAREFVEYAVAGRYHGFSNVRETLDEIHKGMNKAYPCGAGLGLMGVATNGDVALCHRFVGSDAHRLGSVQEGIDRDRQRAFLETHHVDEKTDCRRCWARPLCAGGCYHEAHTRQGDSTRPNLHYCDWIRGWTDICLQAYGEIWERNPSFLSQFDHDLAPERVS